MKTRFIVFLSLGMLLSGCTLFKKSSSGNMITIEHARFKQWNKPPVAQSDVHEQGTDLELTIRNWPEEADPAYIIFRKRKSFPAEVTDTTGNSVTVKARIIRRSSVLSNTSEKVPKSDRLVYSLPDRTTGFIEIEEWVRIN